MRTNDINDLSLPLEYSKLSQYFDMLSPDDHIKNQTIEKILKKYQVKSVLDLTCGTGSQAFWLAKQGFNVIGADLSPELIAIARKKALEANSDIQFFEGDMRTIQLGFFDAVITISNAVGHLSKEDFEKAMRNINNNLQDNGLYIFDIINLDAMTEETIKNLAMDVSKTMNNTQIKNIQYSELDRSKALLTSYDQFFIQEGSSKPKIYKGHFSLQIYTAKEMQDMLHRNGFETLGQYGLDGSEFIEQKTQNILTVAKKKY